MLFLLWLVIVLGIPLYYSSKGEENKNNSLRNLQNALYNDPTGRAEWVLTRRVPIQRNAEQYSLGRFRSDMFPTADAARAYMKEHPCVQYTELEKCLEMPGFKDQVKNAFLLWMFSSPSAVREHARLNCVDVRTAFNVFCRFYGGKYNLLQENCYGGIASIRTLMLTLVLYGVAFWFDGISMVFLIIAIITIPIELFIMIDFEKKGRREMDMTAYDFIIEGVLGGSGVDRVIGVYLGAQAVRLTHKAVKRSW